MQEQDKITEAEYFLKKIIEENANPQAFTYNLSAFLSAARCVLQYAMVDTKKIKGGQKWYNNWMSTNRYFSFFKDERDMNIHVKPVAPAIGVTITPSPVTVRASLGSFSIIIKDIDGTTISAETVLPPPDPIRNEHLPPTTARYRYSFANWSDNTEITTLLQKYLDDLRRFVAEGVARGFLTN